MGYLTENLRMWNTGEKAEWLTLPPPCIPFTYCLSKLLLTLKEEKTLILIRHLCLSRVFNVFFFFLGGGWGVVSASSTTQLILLDSEVPGQRSVSFRDLVVRCLFRFHGYTPKRKPSCHVPNITKKNNDFLDWFSFNRQRGHMPGHLGSTWRNG